MKKIFSLCLIFVLLVSCFVTTANAAAPTVDKAEGSLDASAGEIRITFAENVTDEMLDTISLKKKSGDDLVPIKGGAYIKVDSANPKVAIVKYGLLENKSQYVLTVGEESYNYTINQMEFFEDFEGENYVVGEQLPTRPSTVTEPVIYFPSLGTEPSGKATGTAECHYIGETAGGDKYVSLDPHIAGKGKNGRIVLEFPQPVEDDVLYIDMKVRTNEEYNQSRNIILALLAGGNVVNTNKAIVAAKAGTGGLVAPEKSMMGGGSAVTTSSNRLSKVDNDGFFDLRLSLQRNADGSYKSSLKNLNAPNEGEIKVEGTATGLTGVYCIWLTQFYAANDTREGISVDLSSVRVYRSFQTDILHIDDIEKTDEEMSVVFTNDIDENTLSSVVMMDTDGAEVNITFDRYEEANRKAYYKLGQVLDAGKEYTLSVEGVKDKEGLDLVTTFVELTTEPERYTLSSPEITDENGNAINEIGDATEITYSNEIAAEEGKKFTMALAIFDSDNRLVKLMSDTESVAVGQTSVTLTATTPPDIVLSNGYMIKPYIWEEDAAGGNAFVTVLDEIR